MQKKTIIQTSHAPAAIGPYSQGVGFGGLFFFSGQIPLDPHTGEMVEGGIAEQTTQVMHNIEAVLTAAGLDFSHVLRSTIFLKNLGDFEEVNRLYASYFDENPPARACVEVSRLPKDSLVEIDLIAAAPQSPMPQEEAPEEVKEEEPEVEEEDSSLFQEEEPLFTQTKAPFAQKE